MFYNTKFLDIIIFIINFSGTLIFSNLIFTPLITIISNLICFPGAITYRIINKLFCDRQGIYIDKIKYFKPLALESHYVIYQSRESKKNISIIIGPFIINTLLCALFTFEFSILTVLKTSFTTDKVWTYLSLWLGVSFGYFAIPTKKDIQQIRGIITTPNTKFLTFIDKNIYYFKSNIMYILRYFYAFIIPFIVSILFLTLYSLFQKILIINIIKIHNSK